jgi:hypothetical protein
MAVGPTHQFQPPPPIGTVSHSCSYTHLAPVRYASHLSRIPSCTCTLRRQCSPCTNFTLCTLVRFAHTARLYSSCASCFTPESRTLVRLNSAPPAWQSCLHTPGRLARAAHLTRATRLARLCTSVCCARAASYLTGRDARPPACMSVGRLTPLGYRARARTHPCVVSVLIGRP